jgi:hypothetical protein
MNQLATNYDANLSPINLTLDTPNALLSSLTAFASAPIPRNFTDLRTFPPFTPKTPEQTEELAPVELKQGVIDNSPPTLLNIDFPLADLPSLPLGF